jgi:hypothetical protein
LIVPDHYIYCLKMETRSFSFKATDLIHARRCFELPEYVRQNTRCPFKRFRFGFGGRFPSAPQHNLAAVMDLAGHYVASGIQNKDRIRVCFELIKPQKDVSRDRALHTRREVSGSVHKANAFSFSCASLHDRWRYDYVAKANNRADMVQRDL